MIGLLADLQPVDDDTNADSDTSDNEQESRLDDKQTDKFDQRSHLMVVGDDDQNLYAFRGASIEFIQQFTQNYHISKQQEYYLLDNYRSASNIVELANQFIELSLPANARLKSADKRVHPTDAHANKAIRHGFYEQAQGVDMASWLADDIHKRLSEINAHRDNQKPDNIAQTIAVLAPKWQYFDAVQHYLEQMNITSQRYHESEQVTPINSLIGQALYSHLTNDRLNKIDGDVVEALEAWRKDAQLNHLDMAWSAICDRLQSLGDVTHEELLPILESITYQPTAQVILITYHSAKGMEFDHVYVIDEQDTLSYQPATAEQDKDRPLYVALTRAKRTLTLLQHQKHHHKQLAELAKAQCQSIAIPKVAVPDMLTFHRFLHLDEIVLTPKCLVNERGRAFIKDTFCHNGWSEHRSYQAINGVFKPYKYDQNANRVDGFYSNKNQLLVQFSSLFNKQFTQQDYDAGHLQMVGFTTTLFYQQDLSYYEKAGYTGDATSHYLIVPYVRFGMRVK